MAFDLDLWKQKLSVSLPGWKKRMQRAGVNSTYAFISAAALWPVVEAARQDEWTALTALGGVLAGLGSNLIANQIQGWKDESDAAHQLEQVVAQDVALRAELDAILDTLKALPLAEQHLSTADRAWFAQTIQRELRSLGSRVHYEAMVIGNGMSVQGENITALAQGAVQVKGDVHGDVLAPGATKITALDPQQIEQERTEKARRAYLIEVAERANLLPWANLTANLADPSQGENLRLADVYIALDTTELRQVEREEELRAFLAHQREAQRVSAQEMLNREAHLLLMGDPGSGKSTFVRHITYLLAQACLAVDPTPWLERLAPWQLGARLPVWIELRQVAAFAARYSSQASALLLSYLEDHLADLACAEFGPSFKAMLRAKEPLIFMLDGLDEVPTAQRQVIVDAVRAFQQRYSQHRYLVTCRPYAYVGQPWRLPNFRTMNLAPFTEEQAALFVDNWYARLAERGRLTHSEASLRAGRLKNAVQRRDLQGLAERPLLLTVMAQLHTFRGQLPEDRTELYADAVSLLLQRWESRLGETTGILEYLNLPGLKMSDLEAGLYAVAFLAHQGCSESQDTADIDEGDLRKWLAPYLGNSWDRAGLFINYIRERAGLLIRHKTEAYTFPHRSFQEFLAACHLVGQDYPGEAVRQVQANPDLWRQVFILAAGYAARTHRLSQAIAAVNALLPQDIEKRPAPEKGEWSAARLAAEALLEIGLVGLQREAAGRAMLERLQGWLAHALQADPDLAAVERADAGRALAKLGDPRREVITVAAMPFCHIPAGKFLMGSPEGEGDDDEHPQHEVFLPEFWLARYPVTNAQFAEFVQAGGYPNPVYWTEAAKAEVWKDGWITTRYEQEPRQHPYSFGEPFDLPNHPVVGVTWYEALAFCRWLTEVLKRGGAGLDPQIAAGIAAGNLRVTLPSEAEWEKAARGVRAVSSLSNTSPLPELAEGAGVRAYPWGNHFDADKANITETGIGSTSAVGCFPGGASPYGVLDMSGNVWEWTRSLDGKYPYPEGKERQKREDPKSTAPRVLRGGSYFYFARLARCAFRGRGLPDHWDGYNGFRVVLAPLSL